MSTIPGDSTWRDAGLSETDLAETVDAAQDPAGPATQADQVGGAVALPVPAEEYAPADQVPGEGVDASEADVVEQARTVPEGDDDERR